MCIHAHCAPPLIWGFSHDNYRFEHKVRFLCGERQTTGMKQAEALVEREAKERCESDEGAAASAGGNGEEPAAAVADLADLRWQRNALQTQIPLDSRNCAKPHATSATSLSSKLRQLLRFLNVWLPHCAHS
jgi:hypothetical protein